MHASGSDAESGGEKTPAHPRIVEGIARLLVRRKVLKILALLLAGVLAIETTVLALVARRPLACVHVSRTTLLRPWISGGAHAEE